MTPLWRGLGKGPREGPTGAAARRVHLVVVQLLFSEDGLLVPHGDRGVMGRRGVVSHPLESRFPSADSGAPSPALVALASPGAGSVASLAWPARLGPAVQWEGTKGWEVKAEPEPGASLRQGRGQRRGLGRRGLGEGGGALDLSRLSQEVTSPRGRRPAPSTLQRTGMAKRWPRRAA